MIADDNTKLASLIRDQFGHQDLLLHLQRLLVTGRPVTIEHAATAGGWTREPRAEPARHPGIDCDDHGRLIGFGLTLRPSPHRITGAGRRLFAARPVPLKFGDGPLELGTRTAR